jgi:GntR family transcriptional regulator/MocR family aminotransferase
MTVGRYQAHLRRSGRLYRQRRDAMLHAIERYLPAEVQVVPPQGGLFIWLRLPKGVSATRLLPLAAHAGVTFAPGPAFFSEKTGDNYLRLNFAVQPPDAIEEGLRRLGKVLRP